MRMSRALRSSKILEMASNHKKSTSIDEQYERSFEIMQKIASHVRESKTSGWEKSVRSLESSSSYGRDILTSLKSRRDGDMLKMITDDRMESIREDVSYNLAETLENENVTTDTFKHKDLVMPQIEKVNEAILGEVGIDRDDITDIINMGDIFDDGEWIKTGKYKDFSDNLDRIGIIPRMDYISNYMGLVNSTKKLI